MFTIIVLQITQLRERSNSLNIEDILSIGFYYKANSFYSYSYLNTVSFAVGMTDVSPRIFETSVQ